MCNRGNEVFAFTARSALDTVPDRLDVSEYRPSVVSRTLIHSLRAFEYGWQSNSVYKRLRRSLGPFDAVWRLHPYHTACAVAPVTAGSPMIVGPITDSWPNAKSTSIRAARPRFGVGLGAFLLPFRVRGWQQTIKRADVVIVSRRSLIEKLPELNANCIVAVLPMIVEPPTGYLATTRTFHARKTNSVRLAFVGGLWENKRPLVVCHTVDILRRKGIDAYLTVCGDGPLRRQMEQIAADGAWTNALEFRGNIPNIEIYEQLARSDALLSAAVGEPYGRNVVEAMCVGTPVVAHRSGGPSEVIEHDQDGWLVDDSVGEAFAIAVEQIVQPERWNRLSTGALGKARQWRGEIVGGKLEKLFRETCVSFRRNLIKSN